MANPHLKSQRLGAAYHLHDGICCQCALMYARDINDAPW
jgi:hypothetical protein